MAPALIIQATLCRHHSKVLRRGSCARLGPPEHSEVTMADEHQTNAIIATAILDSVRDHPDMRLILNRRS